MNVCAVHCTGLTDDAYEEAVSWLQVFAEPGSRVQELWRLTAQGRLSFIHGDDMPSLADILKEWPRIGDPKGYLLVRTSSEYSYIYVLSSRLLELTFCSNALTKYTIGFISIFLLKYIWPFRCCSLLQFDD